MPSTDAIDLRTPDAADLRRRRGDLVALLADAIESGASVGYLAPYASADLEAFRDEVADDVAADRRTLFGAFAADAVVGCVLLAPAWKPNQPHRADVQKLLVRRSHRGRGIARRLMAALEADARRRGRTLLTLDTRTGSRADAYYRAWGWTALGTVPGYACDPDGTPAACTFHYKTLAAPPAGSGVPT